MITGFWPLLKFAIMLRTTKRMTMFTVSLALFMDVLDSNIINTAIPAMSRSFRVNPIDLKIALISYLLSLAIFIPISGWTADKYGIKRIFMGALGIFTISSFFCGYAHTLFELVIARSVQGLGGAFMISLGRLIIARTFKRHELVAAMNAVIIVVSVAVMVGPFVGGVITDQLSWPWIFWVNLPAGALVILLAAYHLKDEEPRNTPPFDFLGFIFFGGSLSLLCFSLSMISESETRLEPSLLMLIIAILMMMIYTLHAKRQHHPIIQIKLLRRRTFQISVMGNLCARLGFGGVPFLLPLMQQVALGLSAQLSGLLLVPLAFGIIFSKLMTLQILRKIGYKRFLITNTLLVGILLSIFQIITNHSPLYIIAILTFIFGIFIAAQYTAMNSLAFAEIEEEELSASTSITSTVQILGQSFGVATGAILLRYFSSTLQPHGLLTTTVFHQTFFFMSLLTFISSLIFIRLKSEDGKQMLMTQPESEG